MRTGNHRKRGVDSLILYNPWSFESYNTQPIQNYSTQQKTRYKEGKMKSKDHPATR